MGGQRSLEGAAQTPPRECRPGGPERTSGDGTWATPTRGHILHVTALVSQRKPRVATRGLRARTPPHRQCRKRPAPLLCNVHMHGPRDRNSTRCPPAPAGGFLWERSARDPRSPGWKPGTPGHDRHPTVNAANAPRHCCATSTCMARGIAMRPGVPRLPPEAFCGSVARVVQEAPGGNPGTPGMTATPPSMPQTPRTTAVQRPHAWHAGSQFDPVSPGSRRGLFVCHGRAGVSSPQEAATAAR